MAHDENLLRQAAEAHQRIQEISPAEAQARAQHGAVLVDVREAAELAQDPSVPGAVNIPRGALAERIRQAVPDPNTPVVLYCGGGNRGALATDTLCRLGYTQAVNLQGGLRAWKAAQAAEADATPPAPPAAHSG
jgi:rhodanese-related sulfurtransferase